MKVFLSWQGAASLQVAEALRDWLPQVIQALRPWLSKRDIDKGARWGSELGKELQETGAGILCLTPENLEEPWILFEAGVLVRAIEERKVCPYLFKLAQADLTGPLTQFQASTANREDTLDLVRSLNRALGESAVSDSVLATAFERFWPDLESKLSEIHLDAASPEKVRDEREILEEILLLVRKQARESRLRDSLSRMGLKVQEGAVPTLRGRPFSDDAVFRAGYEAAARSVQSSLWTGVPEAFAWGESHEHPSDSERKQRPPASRKRGKGSGRPPSND